MRIKAESGDDLAQEEPVRITLPVGSQFLVINAAEQVKQLVV